MNDPFWLQPVALLAYWMVENKTPDDVYDEWPFASSKEALQQVYSDMGISTR